MNHYRSEIPKARVNITLDVETGQGKEKKELPLKLLVLGDFSGADSTTKLSMKPRVSVKNAFQALKPSTSFLVDNLIKNEGSQMHIDLNFKGIKDFHPDQIVMQVPELKRLVAMRNLLKDLKANVIDNEQFRKALETTVKDKSRVQHLSDQLKTLVVET